MKLDTDVHYNCDTILYIQESFIIWLGVGVGEMFDSEPPICGDYCLSRLKKKNLGYHASGSNMKW